MTNLHIILFSMLICALNFQSGFSAAVLSDLPVDTETRNSVRQNIDTEDSKVIQDWGNRQPKTLTTLMEYFRNADVFSSIRTLMNPDNGVKKEWVPLGSLMFQSPLGQNIPLRTNKN